MIKIYNRNTQKYDVENVAGGNYIKWCYESPVGKSLTELLKMHILHLHLQNRQ